MVLDEQELRHHLAAAADRASAPRFTVDDLTCRVRRRRPKITGLVSGSLLAVAAIAVAVPVALSGSGTPPTAHPAVVPFRLSFTVAVNGQSRVFPKNGPAPSFYRHPGRTPEDPYRCDHPGPRQGDNPVAGYLQGRIYRPRPARPAPGQ
jgi:hypothetical protein